MFINIPMFNVKYIQIIEEKMKVDTASKLPYSSYICPSNISLSIATVLPAKSDSGVMFCLHHYQALLIDRSLVYQSYPADMVNTQVIYRLMLDQEECTSYFYLAIVNTILRHCHSWLARQ